MGLRSTALTVVAFVVASWAVVLLAGVGTESIVAVGATAIFALTVLAVVATARPVVVVVGGSGPPESASRRRRGAFLRQSNPDTPGRPRPRAPGMAALV